MITRFSEPSSMAIDGISMASLLLWVGIVVAVGAAWLYGRLDHIEENFRSHLQDVEQSICSHLGDLDHELGLDRLEQEIAAEFNHEDRNDAAENAILSRNS